MAEGLARGSLSVSTLRAHCGVTVYGRQHFSFTVLPLGQNLTSLRRHFMTNFVAQCSFLDQTDILLIGHSMCYFFGLGPVDDN